MNILQRFQRADHARDVRHGIGFGLTMATVYSGIVIVERLAFGPEYFQWIGLSVAQLVVLYFVSGIIGGTFGGLLSPLAYRRSGYMLVGAIVCIPLALLWLVGIIPRSHWAGRLVPAGVAFGLVIGPLFGLAFWYGDGKAARIMKRRWPPP